jgi:hypothetical protein
LAPADRDEVKKVARHLLRVSVVCANVLEQVAGLPWRALGETTRDVVLH